jgi:hypothetical protein
MNTTTAPITFTSKTRTTGALGVMGPADALEEAFRTGSPVTLDGKLAGEVVYLGHLRDGYDDGATVETVGLDRHIGETPRFPGVEIACYLLDQTRLDGAPRLAELVAKARNASMRRHLEMEARVAAEDDRLENLAEDGA